MPAIVREMREAGVRRQQRQDEAALKTRTDKLAAMTQQLWQAAKLATLGELSASLAHELNNPLFTVSLHIEAMLAKLPAGDSVALAMGLNAPELVHVGRGALLHDIGKMGVPDYILLKPGKLTDDEWSIMHQHPVFALEMLSPIEYLRLALDIPYSHHEQWDGTSYPRGLEGEHIPLAARWMCGTPCAQTGPTGTPGRQSKCAHIFASRRAVALDLVI